MYSWASINTAAWTLKPHSDVRTISFVPQLHTLCNANLIRMASTFVNRTRSTDDHRDHHRCTTGLNWTELNSTEPMCCAHGCLSQLRALSPYRIHEAANYYSDTFSAYSDKRMHTLCTAAQRKLKMLSSHTLSMCWLYSPFEHPFVHAVSFNATNDLPPLTRYRSSLAILRSPHPCFLLALLSCRFAICF